MNKGIKTDWIIRSGASRWLLALVLLLTLASAAGLTRMGLASDYRVFFDDDDRDLQRLEQMLDTYSTTDNVFIMIEPGDGRIYNPRTLGLVHELTRALWRAPHVSRVDSLTNFPYSSADGDDILIEEFVYELDELTQQRIALIETAASGERDLVGNLLSADGRYTAINATIRLPGIDHKAEVLAVTGAVDGLIRSFEADYPDHRFSVTGVVEMNGAFFQAAKKDFVTLIPLMILFVLISAGLILRSPAAGGAIMVVVVLALLGSLGLAGWLGIQLSAPSVSAPIIMFTVIVASAIHILSYIQRQIRSGVSREEAVLQSYRRNLKPIAVSHITTIIGFLAMNFSDSPPFRDLGNIVALGVLFSLLLSLTVLPQLLLRIRFSSRATGANRLLDRMAPLSDWVIARRRPILWLMLPLSLGLAALSPQNQLDDDLIRYFDESQPFRADAERIDRHFSGIYTIDYSLSVPEQNGMFQPAFLQFLEQFEAWLRQQPEVFTTASPLHRIKDLNRLMNGGDQAFYHLPGDATTAAQQFLLYEMSLPFGRDVTHQVSFDKSSVKLTARLKNLSSVGLIAFEERVEDWLRQHRPQAIGIYHSSPAVIFSHIGQSNIVSLLEGASLAFVVISLTLMLVFRSPYIGLLSLIPNMLPVAAAFGFWYLVNGQISMGLAGVSAMAIGIIVDDTVHFLYQYVDGLKRGLSPEDSVRETFGKTMGGILISSLLLVVGFLLLSTSAFEKNAQMGMLTGMSIVLALIFDLILLPALVLTFMRRAPAVATLQFRDDKELNNAK
ncbi:efflux RND transporter permease subunit [Microbulbifer taiwanensis]|uniref:RND family transporter n=1 Tax=Microbulbifer taiwanensis TaxID=986746 RepID=A0ABW1YTN9_9GAMM|nr:efflux RND transporter permease subunit [Microbulbifer taiwanensis]